MCGGGIYMGERLLRGHRRKVLFREDLHRWLNVLWSQRCVCCFLYTPLFMFPMVVVG